MFSFTLAAVFHASFSFLLNGNTSKLCLRNFFFLFKKTCLICWANINIWSLLRKFEGSNFIYKVKRIVQLCGDKVLYSGTTFQIQVGVLMVTSG